jgi:hypothetical protein
MLTLQEWKTYTTVALSLYDLAVELAIALGVVATASGSGASSSAIVIVALVLVVVIVVVSGWSSTLGSRALWAAVARTCLWHADAVTTLVAGKPKTDWLCYEGGGRLTRRVVAFGFVFAQDSFGVGALFVRVAAARTFVDDALWAARLWVAFRALGVRNGGQFLGQWFSGWWWWFSGCAGDKIVESIEVFWLGEVVGDVGDDFNGVVHGGGRMT